MKIQEQMAKEKFLSTNNNYYLIVLFLNSSAHTTTHRELQCSGQFWLRLQNSRFWTFSEGAKRRKRDPHLWSARASHARRACEERASLPILPRLFHTRSRLPCVRILTVAPFAKTTTVLQSSSDWVSLLYLIIVHRAGVGVDTSFVQMKDRVLWNCGTCVGLVE